MLQVIEISVSGVSTLKFCRKITRPCADPIPVTDVTCRHIFQCRNEIHWKTEFRRVELSTKHFASNRCKPRRLSNFFVELRARTLPLFLFIVKWTKGKDRHGHLLDSFLMPR